MGNGKVLFFDGTFQNSLLTTRKVMASWCWLHSYLCQDVMSMCQNSFAINIYFQSSLPLPPAASQHLTVLISCWVAASEDGSVSWTYVTAGALMPFTFVSFNALHLCNDLVLKMSDAHKMVLVIRWWWCGSEDIACASIFENLKIQFWGLLENNSVDAEPPPPPKWQMYWAGCKYQADGQGAA